MKTQLALFALLATAVLLAGCLGGGSQTNQTGLNTTPIVTPNVTENETDGSGNGDGGNDFLGRTYGELIGLGVPIQCDITTESGTSKLYKGIGSDMRIETPSGQSTCPTTVVIMKADKYYIGCKGGSIIPGSSCQWLVFNASSSGSSGTYEKPDYSDVPAGQISCTPWIPDGSMLQAPASACSLADLINMIG
jgi:hypothetical protein